MSASFTFGSFGDIITTVQLVWRLSQAISDSHGSAQEFQELVEELNRFHRTLDELLKFWQSRTQSVELDRLANSLKPAIDDCREAIESFFRQQFKKYASSFSPQKKGRKSISDVFKCIRWSILEKEKVTQLRDKLRRNKELMDMVHAIASVITREQDRDLITARLDSLANAEAHTANELEKEFGKVIGFLEDQATLSVMTNENVAAVLSELRNTNSRPSNVQAGIPSLPNIYASLDPHRHNSVFIEDALGATIPVPLDINPSWETVESMMRDQFRHRTGQELVATKKYVLQDFVTGKDLDLRTEFHNLVRPGQKIAMSMVFGGMWLNGDIDDKGLCCPRCGKEQAFVISDADITCMDPRCRFIFRRVMVVSDDGYDAIDKWLLQSEVNECSAIPLRDEHDSINDLWKLIAEKESIEGPDNFKRVRYMSRWEDLENSRGSFDTTMNGIGFWNTGSDGWTRHACWNIRILAGAEISSRTSYRIALCPGPGKARNNYLLLGMRFVGYTKRTSVPVLVLIVSSQESRKRLLDVMRLLDFVRCGRIRVVVIVGYRSLYDTWPEICPNPPQVVQLVQGRKRREEGRANFQSQGRFRQRLSA